jgi:hypothetical protein
MDQTYAYFAVFGPDAVEAITAHLGLSPSRIWSKDDPRVKGGTPLGTTKWVLDSDVGKDRAWNEHLAALLPILESRQSKIRDLPEGHEATLQCVAYFRSANPGFSLSPDIMSRVANLGLELDFDIYCLGPVEPHGA